VVARAATRQRALEHEMTFTEFALPPLPHARRVQQYTARTAGSLTACPCFKDAGRLSRPPYRRSRVPEGQVESELRLSVEVCAAHVSHPSVFRATLVSCLWAWHV
jgi:hypothetical protein